ncbi:hypothetical protein DFS33DRAFT_773642 [Desarmillaria ectypa]|nr:hypothetical protein DFS33DRAFT_773642 [Desarmillaria ectypa]
MNFSTLTQKGVVLHSAVLPFPPTFIFSLEFATMGDIIGDICAILCCGLCCTVGSSALNTWSIQNNWGANGCCCGNGQAGCCGSCCDKCFNEDDFDNRAKKDAETTNQQMQPAQQMSVPATCEPAASIPGASKEAQT